MPQRLIVIRGNSGSGKSTIAKKLQLQLGYGTMLVPQDVIRREIIRVKDEVGNPAIELIYKTSMYGKAIGYDVIVEGILTKQKYGEMLIRLSKNFRGGVYVYYFDISFEETLRRHKMKPNTEDFGEEEMRRWWIENDQLGVENEKVFTNEMSEKDIMSSILKDLNLL